jgi:hypothetical protein
METYESLELETIEFDAEDVIASSDPTAPEMPACSPYNP